MTTKDKLHKDRHTDCDIGWPRSKSRLLQLINKQMIVENLSMLRKIVSFHANNLIFVDEEKKSLYVRFATNDKELSVQNSSVSLDTSSLI